MLLRQARFLFLQLDVADAIAQRTKRLLDREAFLFALPERRLVGFQHIAGASERAFALSALSKDSFKFGIERRFV